MNVIERYRQLVQRGEKEREKESRGGREKVKEGKNTKPRRVPFRRTKSSLQNGVTSDASEIFRFGRL